jgi:hypothetical protein
MVQKGKLQQSEVGFETRTLDFGPWTLDQV